MDIGTHALASVALVRAIWPRAPRIVLPFVIVAGTIADIDALSVTLGPGAYLRWHRTYTHSLALSLLFAIFLGITYRLLAAKSLRYQFGTISLFLAVVFTEWLHLALDAFQWEGAALFWPLRNERIALDWLSSLDPWILILLLLALTLPELLRMVSAEIGGKESKSYRRIGAIAGFALLLIYVGARATLHSEATALLEPRTYGGELPHRVAAFPEPVSLFAWHGIVETENAFHELSVNLAPNTVFDPEKAISLYKPEPSAILEIATNTAEAKEFLTAAQFPRASVERTDSGYRVELRDLRNAAAGKMRFEVAVLIDFDPSSRIAQKQFVWNSGKN